MKYKWQGDTKLTLTLDNGDVTYIRPGETFEIVDVPTWFESYLEMSMIVPVDIPVDTDVKYTVKNENHEVKEESNGLPDFNTYQKQMKQKKYNIDNDEIEGE